MAPRPVGVTLAGRLLAELQRSSGLRQAPCLLPATLQLGSWFSTAATQPPSDAAEVARALRCHQFATEELESLKAVNFALPHSQLLDYMRQKGFTTAAAEDVIGRLERSGALLSMAGTVVLRPGEVAEALSMVLPSSAAHTELRLSEARRDLQQLEEQQALIGHKAAVRQRLLAWGGFTSQASLWGVLYWLTFHELSWDFMEPVCFFVGGAQAMAAYLYFMVTRKEFGWETALHRYVGRWEAQQLQQAGFDVQRYARLKKEVQRLSELLRVQQQQAAAGAGSLDEPDNGKKEA